MAGVLFFDLSPSLCGWCAGDGRDTPTADAFRLPELGDDLGGLACALEDAVEALMNRFKPDAVGYEAPILLNRDSLLDLRKIYGLGVILERLCTRRGLACGEVALRRIKTMMTGDHFADKRLVAGAVEKLGIDLPKTLAAGRLDAADAVGGWLVYMSEIDPAAVAPLIATLRGGLL